MESGSLTVTGEFPDQMFRINQFLNKEVEDWFYSTFSIQIAPHHAKHSSLHPTVTTGNETFLVTLLAAERRLLRTVKRLRKFDALLSIPDFFERILEKREPRWEWEHTKEGSDK